MTANVVTTQKQDCYTYSVECLSIHPDAEIFPIREVKRYNFSRSYKESPEERAENCAKHMAESEKYTYIPEGESFITYRSTGTCCGRDYFPAEVDLGMRSVEVIEWDKEKTLEEERNVIVADGDPPRKVRAIGFDKDSAIQKAQDIARKNGIQFVPLKELNCSIL